MRKGINLTLALSLVRRGNKIAIPGRAFRATLRILAATLALTLLGASTIATAACSGDCDDNGAVTVDELILGVNIALDRATVDRCAALDGDGDERVTVSEIVSAVNVLLAGCPQARLIALSRAGRIVSLEVTAPWAVRASDDLGAVIASARCRAGRCLIAHPAPIDAISVVASADLSTSDPIVLEHGADPRDVVLVDSHRGGEPVRKSGAARDRSRHAHDDANRPERARR